MSNTKTAIIVLSDPNMAGDERSDGCQRPRCGFRTRQVAKR